MPKPTLHCDAAVAHSCPEQFGEEARLRAVHGGEADSQAQDDRDPAELWVFGFEQHEPRERAADSSPIARH
jgi:hypothetical protein